MAALKGKDLDDASVGREKLNFDIGSAFITRVSGSILASGDVLQVPIDDTGFILYLRYRDAGITNLYGITSGDNMIVDIRRFSVYGNDSQGKTFDAYPFTSSIVEAQLIDDILVNSNDYVRLQMRINDTLLYQAGVWISRNGQLVDVWYYKIG